MRVQLTELGVLAPRVAQNGSCGDLARQQLKQHHAKREDLPARRRPFCSTSATCVAACNVVLMRFLC